MKQFFKVLCSFLFCVSCSSDRISGGGGVPPTPIPYTIEGTITDLNSPEFQLQVAVFKTKLIQHVKVAENCKITFSDDPEEVKVTDLKNGQQVIVTGFLSGEPFKGLLKAHLIVIIVEDEDDDDHRRHVGL